VSPFFIFHHSYIFKYKVIFKFTKDEIQNRENLLYEKSQDIKKKEKIVNSRYDYVTEQKNRISEIREKLEKESLVSYFYIGQPKETKLGTESRIQLDDAFANFSNKSDKTIV